MRPRDVTQCDEFLTRAVAAGEKMVRPGTAHEQLWTAFYTLKELDWDVKFVRPMYAANVIIQVGMHSLIPIIMEHLTSPDKVNAAYLKAASNQKVHAEWAACVDDLKDACRSSRIRQETEQMTKEFLDMRDICAAIAEDKLVKNGFSILFHIDSISRTVLVNMLPRLTEPDCGTTTGSNVRPTYR